MNALAESLLIARAREEDAWLRALTTSQLASLGLGRHDCRELVALGLAACDGKVAASSLVILTDAGLAMLQQAIPFGAVRPVYDSASRTLSVAGEIILPLATQARNLSHVLRAVEAAGWPPRIVRPLKGRPCETDQNRLAVAAYRLSGAQSLVDFHSDDGAVTWNWRRFVVANGKATRSAHGGRTRDGTVIELSSNYHQT